MVFLCLQSRGVEDAVFMKLRERYFWLQVLLFFERRRFVENISRITTVAAVLERRS